VARKEHQGHFAFPKTIQVCSQYCFELLDVAVFSVEHFNAFLFESVPDCAGVIDGVLQFSQVVVIVVANYECV